MMRSVCSCTQDFFPGSTEAGEQSFPSRIRQLLRPDSTFEVLSGAEWFTDVGGWEVLRVDGTSFDQPTGLLPDRRPFPLHYRPVSIPD